MGFQATCEFDFVMQPYFDPMLNAKLKKNGADAIKLSNLLGCCVSLALMLGVSRWEMVSSALGWVQREGTILVAEVGLGR